MRESGPAGTLPLHRLRWRCLRASVAVLVVGIVVLFAGVPESAARSGGASPGPAPIETLLPTPLPKLFGCGLGEPASEPPAYYAIELVPTGRVPGTRGSTGIGQVTFASSPFGVSVSPGGNYVYELDIRIDRLRPRTEGVYVVWVAKADLGEVRRIGVLGDELRITGKVEWNKFLVVVSLEASAVEIGDSWAGPIVLRGMSRSGRMHTMAGHGAFQAEPCAKYGFK